MGDLGKKFAKLLYKEGSSRLASILETHMVCKHIRDAYGL